MSNFINLFSVVGYSMSDAIGMPLNAHHGYQLFYVLEGKIAYIISGKIYEVKKDECIIVPPFAQHGLDTEFGLGPKILDVQFTVKDVAFDKKVRKISTRVIPKDPSFKAQIKIIISEARKRQGYYYYIAQNMVETMVLTLIGKDQQDISSEEKQLMEVDFEKYSECTRRALRYLEGGPVTGNYELNLDIAAKSLGYNKQYMCKTFASEVGMSIKSYLMLMRIDKARELIDHTDYTLKDISEMLGFSSYIYFTRMFKTYIGVSPLEYRKQENAEGQYVRYSFRDTFEIS